MFVLAEQPDVGELWKAAKLIDLIVNFHNFQHKFLSLCCDPFFFFQNILCFFDQFLHLIVIMLFLFFFDELSIQFLSLDCHLLRLFQFPKSILHVLLLFQQLILHLVVVPEEEHLVIDERFEGM